MTATRLEPAKITKGLVVFGAVALVVAGVDGWFNRRQFFISYLWAYFFWFGLGIGCAVVTMIHHLTGGRWGYPVKRFLEAGLATLPLMALLFVPVLLGQTNLYPWAMKQGFVAAMRETNYLNTTLFTVRTCLYFAIWSYLTIKLRRFSLEQDETRDAAPTRAAMIYSGPGLVIVTLTATFAYVDWIMSLESGWRSTAFPLVILAGQTLMGFCFCAVLLRTFKEQESIARLATADVNLQLGNLLLTFVLFWTYVAFGQFLIIYAANEPDEISWYLRRIADGWKAVLIIIALFHFLVPFLLLLFRRFKQSGKWLFRLSFTLLVIHVLYTYWLIVPCFREGHFQVTWIDAAVFLGVGGIWCGAFLWLLGRAPLVPLNNVRRQEELLYAES